MEERPSWVELIVVGDFNMDLEKMGSRGRDKEIVAALATAGLEYLSGNFSLRRQAWCKDQRTYVMVRQGRVVQSRTD